MCRINNLVLGFFLWIGLVYSLNLDPWSYDFENLDYLGENTADFPRITNGPTIVLEENWPDSQVFDQIGIVTSLQAEDSRGSTVYVLQRGKHGWDENTFYENNTYKPRSAGPIKEGALVKIVNGKIAGKFIPNVFYMPHGFSRDSQGNFWITDVGLHQVFKFPADLSSKPLLTLGEAFVPGSDHTHFCKPTDVVVASNGDFFVSDGYCNNRIMKFHANGTLIKSWGENFEDPVEMTMTSLNLPHQLALDEDWNLLCVADRENARIVCFNAGLNPESSSRTGQMMFQLKNPDNAPIFGVAINKPESLIIALVGWSENNSPSKLLIYDLNSRTLISALISNKQFGYGMAHMVTSCPPDPFQSCFLVCNTNEPSSEPQLNKRMWKYQIHAESFFPN